MTRYKKWILNIDDSGIEGGRCYLYAHGEESSVDTWLQEKLLDKGDGATNTQRGDTNLSDANYGYLEINDVDFEGAEEASEGIASLAIASRRHGLMNQYKVIVNNRHQSHLYHEHLNDGDEIGRGIQSHKTNYDDREGRAMLLHTKVPNIVGS